MLVLRDNAGAAAGRGAGDRSTRRPRTACRKRQSSAAMPTAEACSFCPTARSAWRSRRLPATRLHPNPFGRINVVGRNAQLLIKVSRDGHEDYIWKQILDFNMAYWSGMTQTYAITWQTHLPPRSAPAPLPSADRSLRAGPGLPLLACRTRRCSYRVYASEEPYDQWDRVGTTSSTAYTHTPNWHTRYAVTVVDGRGKESGFSPIYRAFYWVYPADAVYDNESRQLAGAGRPQRRAGADSARRAHCRQPYQRALGVRGRAGDVAGGRQDAGDRAGERGDDPQRRTCSASALSAAPTASRPARSGDGCASGRRVLHADCTPARRRGTLLLGHFDGDLDAGGDPPADGDGVVSPMAYQDRQRCSGDGARLAYGGDGPFRRGRRGAGLLGAAADWDPMARSARLLLRGRWQQLHLRGRRVRRLALCLRRLLRWLQQRCPVGRRQGLAAGRVAPRWRVLDAALAQALCGWRDGRCDQPATPHHRHAGRPEHRHRSQWPCPGAGRHR